MRDGVRGRLRHAASTVWSPLQRQRDGDGAEDEDERQQPKPSTVQSKATPGSGS